MIINNNNIKDKDHKLNIVQTMGFNWCCRGTVQCYGFTHLLSWDEGKRDGGVGVRVMGR